MRLSKTVQSLALVALLGEPLSAQKFLSFPLSDASVPVWHGWFYDDGSYHGAADYPEPLGTAILAAADGLAMVSSQPYNSNNPDQDTYGTFVLIQHPNGFSTLYAHMSAASPAITAFSAQNRYNSDFGLWTTVKKGDVIGYVGLSGVVTTTRPHLHFEVANNPLGTYSGHVQNRVDSYDLFNVALFYPPSGSQFTSCGPNFLWTGCPILTGVTYTYTGNPFTTITGSPGVTTSNFISATLTFPCVLTPSLTADLSGVMLQSWFMTDGVHDLSSSDANSQLFLWFYLGTDATGRITKWSLTASNGDNAMSTRDVAFPDEVYWDGSDALSLYSGFANPASWFGPTGANSCATQTYVKYTYTGNSMRSSDPSATGTLNIVASFVVPAALAPSQSGLHIAPLAWAIGDSYYIANFGNGDKLTDLEVWTDSLGTIVGWNFSAAGKEWPAAGGLLTTSNTAVFMADISNVLGLTLTGGGCGPCFAYTAQNAMSPGIWIAGPL